MPPRNHTAPGGNLRFCILSGFRTLGKLFDIYMPGRYNMKLQICLFSGRCTIAPRRNEYLPGNKERTGFMTILHPSQPVNNMNPEDVFYAVDDLGTQTGYAFILYQLQPGLYPDCPVNMYFTIEGDASSRYLLFGAVIARARLLLNVNPQLRSRLYTSLDPQDLQSREFYVYNGFDLEESDSLFSLQIPFGDGRIPMSCTVAATPLNTWEEQEALLTRLQMNEITYID